MTSTYSLTLIDDIIINSFATGKEYLEFSKDVSELEDLLNSEFYIEAVRDDSPDAKKFLGAVKKNTWDTTKDVGKVYGDIISGNANVIKASWDLLVKIIQSIGKVLGFILNKIASIPEFLLKIGANASDLTVEMKAKISGNITLNITASDIEMIYNKLFIRRLIDYINDAAALSRGDFWSTFLHRRSPEGKVIIKENDMKICKRMMSTYSHLENTEFRPTIIDLRDKRNINIYFGADKLIRFTDNYGKKHQLSYTEALSKLTEDIKSKRSELETLHQAIGTKLKESELNQNYANLTNHNKYLLNTTLSQIAKVSSIMGNFIKYIVADGKTIKDNYNKILGIKGKSPVVKK